MTTNDHLDGRETAAPRPGFDAVRPAPVAGAPDPLLPATPTFDAAFADLSRVAYRVAYRILGDREDARDVVQEALARAYVRWDRVHEAAPAWVSRVAANLALDLVRRRARRPDPGQASPTSDTAQVVADRLELVKALQALSKRQREVVVLRYVADLSEIDVARLIGCSTGTVKRHAHRGLESLRSSLRPSQLADLEVVT